MLKSIKNFVFMSILALTYLLLRFVHLLSFLRSLFICPCGSHRHLFVICSFIVRSLFVICSSHFSVTTLPLLGRGLGRGYFVRLFFICPCGSHRHSFVSLFRYYTPSPWERGGERIFPSSFLYLPV